MRLATTLSVIAALAGPASFAAPSLEDYRHFRALSLDLNGRIPTRDEVKAFEAPGFDLQGWVDAHLSGRAYVERLTRVYLDALRLEQITVGLFLQQMGEHGEEARVIRAVIRKRNSDVLDQRELPRRGTVLPRVIEQLLHDFGGKGLRTLGVCCKRGGPALLSAQDETEMVLSGIAGTAMK